MSLLEKLAAGAPTNAVEDDDDSFESMPGGGGHFDIEAFIVRHNLDVNEPESYEGGRRWTFGESPLCDCQGGQVLVQFPSGAIVYKCSHNTCESKYGAANHWKHLREKYEPGCYVVDQADDERPVIIPPANHKVSTLELAHRGFIRTFAVWHARRSQYNSVRMGAIAGMAAMSMLMARRVRLLDDTRPNISIASTAVSGAGKTEAVDSIKLLFQQLNMQAGISENVSGAAAIEDELWICESVLLIFEEAHNLIKVLNNTRDNNLATIVRSIKQCYSMSKTWVPMRKKAAERTAKVMGENHPVNKPRVLDQPHLTLWLTAPSDLFWNSLSEESLRDGFVGRLAQIETTISLDDNEFPHNDEELFAELLRIGQGWLDLTPPVTCAERVLPGYDGLDHRVVIQSVQPFRLQRTAEGQALAKAAKKDFMRAAAKAEQRLDSISVSCWARTFELSCKLELIFAGSEWNPDGVEIELVGIPTAVTKKAIAVARKMTAEKLSHVEGRVGDENHEILVDKVRRKLVEKKSMKWRDAYTAVHLKPSEFVVLVESLIMSEEVGTDAVFGPNGRIVNTRGKYVWLKGHKPKLEKKS